MDGHENADYYRKLVNDNKIKKNEESVESPPVDPTPAPSPGHEPDVPTPPRPFNPNVPPPHTGGPNS